MADEAITLGGLPLSDRNPFGLLSLDMPVPRQRQDWIGAADSEFQVLSRRPLHENRKITAKISVEPQTLMDTALDKIGFIVDKLAAASKPGSAITLTWTPQSSARTVTFDVLAGEIVDLPINWDSGWLSKTPEITIELTCQPYWRGSETLTSTQSSNTPIVLLEIGGVNGDVPALGRMIVTDLATQSRRHVEWGLEGPDTYQNIALLLDSDSLVTSGFSGVGEVLSGSYDPNGAGNNSIFANSYPVVTALCGTGNQSHLGSFRVRGRFAFSGSDVCVRLAWRAGDGPMNYNDWVPNTQGAIGFQDIDLGTITVPAVISGTQRWIGQIEIYSPGGTGPGVHLDYLILVPISDGYGKARSNFTYTSGVVAGSDQFSPSFSGLNGRTAPLGGTWATSGDATDFVWDTNDFLVRGALSSSVGRFAVLGSTNMTDTDVSVQVSPNALVTGASFSGVIGRWVDANNHVRAFVTVDAGGTRTLQLQQILAGVATTAAIVYSGPSTSRVQLVVYASGRAIARVVDASSAAGIAQLEIVTAAMATGGALDDGKPGIWDFSSSSTAGSFRFYDNFVVGVPVAEPIALYAGRNMQVRYDDTIRQDSTGTYTGRPGSYNGSRFMVPVGTSRVLVKARRNDIEAAADDAVTDNTQIQVGWTPRGLAVPR